MRFVTFPLAGSRLTALRKHAGETAQQLAEVMGVSAGKMSAIEGGYANPSLYALIKAADHFAVPLTFLAGDNVEGLAS